MAEHDQVGRKAHLRQLVERALPMTTEWDSVRQNVALSLNLLHQANIADGYSISEEGGNLYLVEKGYSVHGEGESLSLIELRMGFVRGNLQGRDGSGLLSKLSEGLFDDQQDIPHHQRNLVIRGDDSMTASVYKLLMAISYAQTIQHGDGRELTDDVINQFGINVSKFADKYGKIFPVLLEQADALKNI